MQTTPENRKNGRRLQRYSRDRPVGALALFRGRRRDTSSAPRSPVESRSRLAGSGVLEDPSIVKAIVGLETEVQPLPKSDERYPGDLVELVLLYHSSVIHVQDETPQPVPGLVPGVFASSQ